MTNIKNFVQFNIPVEVWEDEYLSLLEKCIWAVVKEHEYSYEMQLNCTDALIGGMFNLTDEETKNVIQSMIDFCALHAYFDDEGKRILFAVY